MTAEPGTVAPGEWVRIGAVGIPTDAVNITLLVQTHSRTVYYVSYPSGEIRFGNLTFYLTFLTWSGEVKDDWGFGDAVASLSFTNATGTVDIRAHFRVVCEDACLVARIDTAAAAVMQQVWMVVFSLFLLTVMFVGHAAHVYRTRGAEGECPKCGERVLLKPAELSWWESVRSALRLSLRRDLARADLYDRSGYAGRHQREELGEAKDAIFEAEKPPGRFARLRARRKNGKVRNGGNGPPNTGMAS